MDNFRRLFKTYSGTIFMLDALHPYLVAAIGGVLIGVASWLLWLGLGRIPASAASLLKRFLRR
jgi:hypothetical protein